MTRSSDQEQIDAIITLMEADSGRIEAVSDAIGVTLPDTRFRVLYRKPADEPGLVVSEIVHDPWMSLAEQTRFLANTWRLANDQARTLRWIV